MGETGSLAAWLSRGEVYFNIPGDRPESVLAAAMRIVQPPGAIGREEIFEALLERESVASTAIGEGFAVPHPREPMLQSEDDTLVAVCYLERKVGWDAPDGLPVDTLFIVLSAGQDGHLAILSEIASLAQTEEFREFLRAKPGQPELMAYISEKAAKG